MSTYTQTDPCTNLILDFIAGPESGGNYNAYYGNSGSTIPFITYSLARVYAFQATMRGGSTAVLRYQFLNKTLEGLQKKLNLPNSAICTPELQDRLAVELLIECKYPAWWKGQLPNDEFASRISEKWSSLPDPMNGGKSHYDGDSMGNRALVTLSAVYAMLNKARSLQAVPIPTVTDIQRLGEVAAGCTIYGDETIGLGSRLGLQRVIEVGAGVKIYGAELGAIAAKTR